MEKVSLLDTVHGRSVIQSLYTLADKFVHFANQVELFVIGLLSKTRGLHGPVELSNTSNSLL